MSVDALDRLDRIRGRLEEDGRAKVGDLASWLGVSEMTIRRDLDELERRGELTRVRGGATLVGPRAFAERTGRHARAKRRIAAKLVELVPDGIAVGLDASSTILRLAEELANARDVTVLTNGPECFNALRAFANLEVLLTGGRIDPRTGSLVGPLALRSIHDMSLHTLFLSSAGLDPEVGSTESTLEEATVKQALAATSHRVVLAVDSTKLAQRAPAKCLPLDAIDVLVTDLDPNDPKLGPYRAIPTIL